MSPASCRYRLSPASCMDRAWHWGRIARIATYGVLIAGLIAGLSPELVECEDRGVRLLGDTVGPDDPSYLTLNIAFCYRTVPELVACEDRGVRLLGDTVGPDDPSYLTLNLAF